MQNTLLPGVEAMFAEGRTTLGAAQKAWLLSELGASSALFVPIEPDAPGWLTITTFWLRCFSSSAAVIRVTWSVEPPAAQGTMMVMGFDGFQLCACTGNVRSTAIRSKNLFMLTSSVR